MGNLSKCVISSPAGYLDIAVDEAGVLREILFAGPEKAAMVGEVPDACKAVVNQLAEYFAGDRRAFDVKVMPDGTEFRRKIWAALQEIPYGETWTYGQLAKHVGSPKAAHAVGAACGSNPISIVIPCHRVVGSNGSLTGFGGGIETKKMLLELESDQGAMEM
ncbi:MAG TPA: methylated-DNA--[protein]-cysteine S-methyltransferase [Bacteroidetes bacterium]|nr:methylated-DNA--[protein]-cysteine S-methyltransferase [Bacteroidota bacterium]HEX05410.1 methylated-DNA--[protein]-cysteine S-methyltransferase [Bacteroidota bacterium]